MLEGDQGWSTAVVTESALPGGRRPVPLFDDRRSAIGLRTARYSYIVNRAGLDELYDLAVDPLQNRNKIEVPVLPSCPADCSTTSGSSCATAAAASAGSRCRRT